MKWILLGTTTLNKSGHGNDSNEGVLHDHQSSRAGVSPSDNLVSYPGYSLNESYLSAEMELERTNERTNERARAHTHTHTQLY